jgi:Zn finger protein HypA/HybF involved in hydrogenase expression
MGKQYQAKCLSCSHEFTLKKGGGMKWYQKICDTCGTCIAVPRKAPETANSAMNKAQLIRHLADRSGWSRNGGQFEPAELALIEELSSQCGCGGQMIPEWHEGVLYRCPECRAHKLEMLTDIPIAYD